MAQVNGKNVENLSPSEAEKRGYLLPDEVRACEEWIAADFEYRQLNTIVYVNGVYVGVAKKNTKLTDICVKFKVI